MADVLVLNLCEDVHCVARLSLTSPAELELAAAGFRIGWPHRPCTEPEFLNFFKEPRIDSKEPRAGTTTLFLLGS